MTPRRSIRLPWRPLAIGLLAAWLVAPLVPLAIWSFARGWRFPDLLPARWTLEPWRLVLAVRSGILDALVTSLAVSTAAAGLALVLGLPAGRALGLHRFPGRSAVALLFLAPVIVPGIAVALGLHGVFLALGLTGGIAGVILVHLVPTLPYVVLVTAAFFADYDRSYEDQARSLGAGRWQCLVHVTLPLVLPAVVVAGLFAFLVSWSQYVLTLAIGGGRVVTLPLLLYATASAGRHDLAGAVALVTVLPGFLVAVLASRRLTGAGPAAGGLVPR